MVAFGLVGAFLMLAALMTILVLGNRQARVAVIVVAVILAGLLGLGLFALSRVGSDGDSATAPARPAADRA